MKRRLQVRPRLVAGLATCVALGAYTFAYYKVPVLRCWQGDVRVYQMRCFDKDFEPYFFAPAGLAEALLVRIARQVHPQSSCGEAIVLCTSHVRLQFRAKADLPPNDRPIPRDADILDYVGQRDTELLGLTAYLERTLSDGSKLRSRHLSFELDDAEDYLRDRYQRPYTIQKALRWYDDACDEPSRIHLLVLLAASRDPRAALILGNALMSTSTKISLAAVGALDHFFGTTQCAGESEFAAAFKWLEENGTRLQRDARESRNY